MSYVKQLPARETPEYVQPLLAAHDALLRASYEFFASIKGDIADKEGLPRPGVAIPYVLFAKLIQLGRAVHALAILGYTEEAEPLARAMVSAALNIVGITDAEPDARALRFMETSSEIRSELIKGYIAEGYVDADAVNSRDAEWRRQESEILTRYAEVGIRPAKIADQNKYTWHGLSDRKLALEMNASRWYNLYYRNFSDEAHANVAGVASALRLLLARRNIRVGPSHNDPWMVVTASADTIGECLAQLDTLLKLGRRKEVDAIIVDYGEALKAHRAVMPEPDLPLDVSGNDAQEGSEWEVDQCTRLYRRWHQRRHQSVRS